MSVDKSKYIEAFVEEARDNLQTLNACLLSLESEGYNQSSLNEAYRVMHTIKGTASAIGIEVVSKLTHEVEDLLDFLRERHASPDQEAMAMLFNAADTVERILTDLERDGRSEIDVSDQVSKVRAYMGGSRDDLGQQAMPKAALSSEQRAAMQAAAVEGKRAIEVRLMFQDDLAFREGRAYQAVRALGQAGTVIESFPNWKDITDTHPGFIVVITTAENDDKVMSCVQGVTGISDVRLQVVEMAKGEEAKEEGGGKSGGLATGSTIRVKSKLLDKLLDLVGEIMINNIRINQISMDLKNRELKQILQNNARLMGELQDIVLRTRMVQVDFIFKRFPRMVRDMASENGKEIDFAMRGNDIEIDRSLLDEIGDALVHLLRNACDHGIEPTDGRVAAGKSPRGTVILSAYQEQSNVIITIEDDGRGIDPEKVRRKAIEKGLFTEEEMGRMDERAVINIIFMPGFSTADKVTDISGRGVGMDVVRTKIEGMGGFVKVESVKGKGTKIILRLPPSMSIIRAMLVEVNEEKYAIPLENVRETVRVPAASIHEVADKGMFRLRDEILPVLNVHEDFGGQAFDHKDIPAIIVEKNDNRACLLVTRLIGQQEIVVKNVGRDLRGTGLFSGATILGDGKVAMILDVGAFL
jgi:two-component system chemotaxis sensor kinase CheA